MRTFIAAMLLVPSLAFGQAYGPVNPPIGTTTGTAGDGGVLAGVANGTTALPRVNIGSNITVSGAQGPANAWINQTGFIQGTTTDSFPSPLSFTFNDQVASTSPLNGLIVHTAFGGGGFTGNRNGIASYIALNAAPNAADASQQNYVSGLFQGYMSVPTKTGLVGGSLYAGYAGAIWGINPNVFLTSGATNVQAIYGGEFDVSVQTGANVAEKVGILIVQSAADTARGSISDAAILINNQAGATSGGWQNGISLGGPRNLWPFSSTSTLIGATQQTQPSLGPVPTALNGVDFRAVSFAANGVAFGSPGFSVDPSGNTIGLSFATGSIQGPAVGIASLSYVSGGSYTALPTVTIAAPTSGVRATALPVMGLSIVSLASGGTGYTAGDHLTYVGGTGTAAQATVTSVSGGVITGVAGYVAGAYSVLPPNFTTNPVTGGTGTGATLGATFYVASYTMTAAGSGYTSVPAVTLTGGATATAVLNAGSSILISAPTGVQVTSPATFTATVNANTVQPSGSVSAITIGSGGIYSTVPTVSLAGPGGNGGTATATIAGYTYSGASVVSGGTGYIVNDLLTGPSGLIVRVSAVSGGAITALAGTGTNPVVSTIPAQPYSTFTGGSGTGASITLGYAVNSVTIVNGGGPYTTAPVVTFSGGTVMFASSATGTSSISTLLTLAGSLAVSTRTITAGGSDTAVASDIVIKWTKTTGSASAQTIPACAATNKGRLLTVKDGKGDANTNNITITPVSGTIDGAATYIVSTVRGAVQMQCDGGTDYSILAKF